MPVTVANHNDANVSNWKFEMLDVPPASSVPVGTMLDGAGTTAAFTPDATGCYLVRLTVTDWTGKKTRSTPLAFGILETNGRLIPPAGAIDKSLNFSGQTRGWAKYLEEWLGLLTAGVPALVNVLGATIVEDPAGSRISRRLRYQDIDADFAIASFSRSGGALVRRGDALSGVTCSASYVSGPPTGGVVADSFANGAAGAGAWTFLTPFAAGSRAGTISANGVDGSPDPSWMSELTASLAGYPDRVASVATYWSSDVYWGSTAATDIVGTDVYSAGLVGSFQSALQRTRGQVRSFTGATRYDWFLWPNEATYTSGVPVFKDAVPLTYATTDFGTVSIVRNGVTRTYRKIRSAGRLSADFTVTVT